MCLIHFLLDKGKELANVSEIKIPQKLPKLAVKIYCQKQ